MTSYQDINFKGIDLRVHYETTPYSPEVRYLPNGDPGYPAEGGDFDIYSVELEGVDILCLLSQDTIDSITTICCENDYGENTL